MSIYWLLYFVLGLWVAYDANKRENNFIGWGLGTFVIGPIVLPIYLAKRNLKANEVREGGTSWNILKNFALFWTITMVIAGINDMIGAGSTVNQAATEAEQAGAAIGATLGFGLLANAVMIIKKQ